MNTAFAQQLNNAEFSINLVVSNNPNAVLNNIRRMGITMPETTTHAISDFLLDNYYDGNLPLIQDAFKGVNFLKNTITDKYYSEVIRLGAVARAEYPTNPNANSFGDTVSTILGGLGTLLHGAPAPAPIITVAAPAPTNNNNQLIVWVLAAAMVLAAIYFYTKKTA